jgi:hypothetical protein
MTGQKGILIALMLNERFSGSSRESVGQVHLFTGARTCSLMSFLIIIQELSELRRHSGGNIMEQMPSALLRKSVVPGVDQKTSISLYADNNRIIIQAKLRWYHSTGRKNPQCIMSSSRMKHGWRSGRCEEREEAVSVRPEIAGWKFIGRICACHRHE